MSVESNLVEIATAVRRVMESPSFGCGEFPTNWCTLASFLVAKYLAEVKGLSGVEVVNGSVSSPNYRQHDWVEYAGFIIDITADQYPERRADAVIVTTSRTWHDQFQDQFRVQQSVFEATNEFNLSFYPRLLDAIGPLTHS